VANVAYQPRRTLCAVGCMRLFGGLPKRVADGRSGGNFHHRVKIDLPRCSAWHYSSQTWAGRTKAVSPHPAKVELNGSLDSAKR
jgi:hypothetical protein